MLRLTPEDEANECIVRKSAEGGVYLIRKKDRGSVETSLVRGNVIQQPVELLSLRFLPTKTWLIRFVSRRLQSFFWEEHTRVVLSCDESLFACFQRHVVTNPEVAQRVPTVRE